jgi:hypothetical protein
LGDALSQGSNGVANSGEVQYSDENILGTGTVVKSDAVWTALASSLL